MDFDNSGAANSGVLIVIPCLNEEANIASVVNAALEDNDKHKLLVVVADGGSTDNTCGIVRQLAAAVPNTRLIDNPRKIQSAGVNRAVSLFGEGNRWLVRMDAHALYPQRFVSTLVSEAERTGANSVVVAMHSSGKKWFQKAVAIAQNSLLGAGGSPHRSEGKAGFVDHGHHALFDLNMFKSLKGYDESISHNEDAEFDVRLVRAGGRIWLTRAVSIIYYPRERVVELYKQYQNYGRGRASTILRHGTRPKVRQLLPAAVVPSSAFLLAAPWIPAAAVPTSLWLAVCLIYGIVLGLRIGKSYAFASGIAAIVMHIGWSTGFWRGLLRSIAISRSRFQHKYP